MSQAGEWRATGTAVKASARVGIENLVPQGRALWSTSKLARADGGCPHPRARMRRLAILILTSANSMSNCAVLFASTQHRAYS